MISAGDILHVYCVFLRPPDHKYVVCVCPKYPLFFLINSLPRHSAPDAQVFIKKDDFPFLSHDSYINTAMLCRIYKEELGKAKKVDTLNETVKAEIVTVVKGCGYLAQTQKELVENNLSVR